MESNQLSTGAQVLKTYHDHGIREAFCLSESAPGHLPQGKSGIKLSHNYRDSAHGWLREDVDWCRTTMGSLSCNKGVGPSSNTRLDESPELVAVVNGVVSPISRYFFPAEEIAWKNCFDPITPLNMMMPKIPLRVTMSVARSNPTKDKMTSSWATCLWWRKYQMGTPMRYNLFTSAGSDEKTPIKSGRKGCLFPGIRRHRSPNQVIIS